jgi:2-desacetyl-2-hydroxyethyl bacteriochlorophyllide A dehydrogenase
MKAVVLNAKNMVEFSELPDPQMKNPEDVKVQLNAVSLCETDAKILDGSIPTKKRPIVIGHEGAGVVVDIGKDVKNTARGDKVLIDPNIYDTTCYACRGGFSNLCLSGGLMGREVDGVFQQLMIVPSRNVFLLPENIQTEVAPLIQPFSTVVHGHRQIEINPGDVVVVLGLGVVGLMLAQLAKLRGAKVVGVDIVPAKLELAKKLGIDITLNSLEADPEPEVRSLTNGHGADVAIEAAGVPDLIRKAMQMLRCKGALLQFGLSPKQVTYNMYDAYIKELAIQATRSSLPQDFEDAVRIVSQGKIDLNYQISKVFKFEEAKEAINFFHDRAKALKVIIKT